MTESQWVPHILFLCQIKLSLVYTTIWLMFTKNRYSQNWNQNKYFILKLKNMDLTASTRRTWFFRCAVSTSQSEFLNGSNGIVFPDSWLLINPKVFFCEDESLFFFPLYNPTAFSPPFCEIWFKVSQNSLSHDEFKESKNVPSIC